MRNLEDRIYREQERIIRRDYGKRAADQANYGWGVDEDDGSIIVSTKVYGHGVLITYGDRSTGVLDHAFACDGRTRHGTGGGFRSTSSSRRSTPATAGPC